MKIYLSYWLVIKVSILGICLVPSLSFACYNTPIEFIVSDESLVSRTSKIYWAEAVAKKDNFEYEFKVIDDLKANRASGLLDKILSFLHINNYEPVSGNTSNFTLQGYDRPYKSGDFNLHKDESYMTGWQGRVEMAPDCELNPTFEVGKKYLIFFDKPYHFKAFEEVSSIDDKWYLKVRKLIK